jgi:hypothetical protein
MNPVYIFPTEVCELVFQHFSGAELLALSELSSSFDDYIAISKAAMKKFKIKLAKKKFDDNDKNLLIQSVRRYESLELCQFASLVEPTKEILTAPGANFKHISVNCIDFETICDIIKFFKTFEPTAEELKMTQVYMKSNFRESPIPFLQFPKLKVLEMKCCQAALFHEAFVNCRKLKTFVIKSGSSISSQALNAIKNILKSNVELEILGIHFTVFNLIFNENISSFVRFKLKEFHVNDLYRLPGSYFTVKENLHKFLAMQMETLEVLSIGDWNGHKTLELIFHMTKLKDLTLKGFHRAERWVEWKKVDLPTNLSIVKFNLSDMSKNFEIFSKLLTATPNLQTLKLYALDQKSMEFLSSNCKLLTSLEIEHFQATDVSDENLFKNLKTFEAKKLHKIFHFNAEAALTHFEKLILNKLN